MNHKNESGTKTGSLRAKLSQLYCSSGNCWFVLIQKWWSIKVGSIYQDVKKMTSLNTVRYDTRFNVTPHVFSSLNMGTKVVKLVPNGLFEKERERRQ